jgi:hypothetical protein
VRVFSVWVVFHSRKDKWDTVKSANITLLAGSTVLLDGGFKVYQPPVVLSYVTTTSDYKSAVVHVQNTQSSSATVASIVFNGQTFNASECGSPNVVPPNQNNVWVVPLSSPLSSGTLWTVVITYTGGIPPTVGGGRVIKPHFPVEHWPKSTDCPYPGINDKNYKFLKDTTSFDTWFLYDTKKCSTTQEDIANNLAAKNGFYVFFDNDVDTSKVCRMCVCVCVCEFIMCVISCACPRVSGLLIHAYKCNVSYSPRVASFSHACTTGD